MAKKRVQIFISYAHGDETQCEKLKKLLWRQLKPSASFDFRMWGDGAILSGEHWLQEIEAAVSDSDLGLLLVSPAFLGSDFITERELPRFVGSHSKPAIPVEVETVNFEKHDLKGLQEHQLFRLHRTKPFAKCAGVQRTLFVEKLYDQIEDRLKRLGF